MDFFRANPHLYFDAAGIGLFLLALVLEAVAAAVFRRPTHSASDTATNLVVYLGSVAIQYLWLPVVFAIYVRVYAHSIWKIGDQWWLFQGRTPLWVWPLAILADDFTFYWFHRASHRFSVLWAAHETHHSSRFFNLSTAARQTWFPFTAFLFWLPLVAIGFEPFLVLSCQLGSLFLQAFLHTPFVGRLGPLDRIFNTPSNHRVHHGRNPEYLDRNFGGLLIVWDRLFGTYVPEGAPVVYGTHETYPKFNPLVVAFRETLRLFRKPARAAVLAGLAAAILLSGCDGTFRRMGRDRTVSRLERVKKYHGTFRESGILSSGEDLVTEIEFTAPTSYRMKVLAPKALKGMRIEFEGGRSTTIFPAGGWGIRMRGLPEVPPERLRAGLEKILDDTMVNYTYGVDAFRMKKLAPVAGYPVTELTFSARNSGAAIPEGRSEVLDELAFPLAGELRFAGGKIYRYRFDSIRFNEESDPMAEPTRAELAAEKGLLFSEWDFSAPPLTETAAKAAANFRWTTPKDPPRGLKRVGIFRQKGIVPAFAIVYANEPYFATVFVSRDYHLRPFADARGIPLGPRGDRYVPNPHLSSYEIRAHETITTILSNLPAEDLIAYGASLP
ncbi:MAG: sterol desaturase family protein [Bdellovibrionales bacterium]|nr:sterol desaturase family protein [Bdellovibrionales bacterium]